ncbi:Rhox homeobox family member 1 [Pteropus alecto]|uniref:Rhox homeobox family member 1 n=1 Tax=Pteropus alecto TaxID=9402 RepID=L5L546_PTEAL|nr:Rhox homeobox family member 1 [Pteropus alecto]
MVHVVAVIALQNRQPRIQHNKFTPAQLQELESTFEHTRYLDAATRQELARHIDVTEAKVQVSKPERKAICQSSHSKTCSGTQILVPWTSSSWYILLSFYVGK